MYTYVDRYGKEFGKGSDLRVALACCLGHIYFLMYLHNNLRHVYFTFCSPATLCVSYMYDIIMVLIIHVLKSLHSRQ